MCDRIITTRGTALGDLLSQLCQPITRSEADQRLRSDSVRRKVWECMPIGAEVSVTDLVTLARHRDRRIFRRDVQLACARMAELGMIERVRRGAYVRPAPFGYAPPEPAPTRQQPGRGLRKVLRRELREDQSTTIGDLHAGPCAAWSRQVVAITLGQMYRDGEVMRTGRGRYRMARGRGSCPVST